MYDEPCIDIYDTKYLTVTFKIFNYLRFSAMCYNDHFNALILYDFSGCMFKYTVNLTYGYIHDSLLNEQQYEDLKINHKSPIKRNYNTNNKYHEVIMPSRKLKPYDIPDRFIKNSNTIIMQYPTPKGPKPVISTMKTVSSSLLTYEDKEKLITLFDIINFNIYQKIILAMHIDELLFRE